MKKILTTLLLLMVVLTANAQSRRPIDPQHPMYIIHIDAWNYPDPQQIIDLIPEDIKPYVCLNLSLSCAYNTTTKYHQKPENAVLTFKSWASVCCQNNVWFMCQHASGGHCHIKDDDLDTFEYFFKHYKNFLGWNYAEQFWGFGEPNDEYSMTDVSRIQLFSKLVPMSHKYGGVLVVSFCGNIYSHPLNPVAMMKRNADLLNACRQYPEAILWCYKYTTAACWYNNESVCLGPFVSGLAKNYGLRYDNCGWDGGTGGFEKARYGSERSNRTYPESVGIGPVLDQIVNNGACVYDGPELIWTQCFKESWNRPVDGEGFAHRNWSTYTQFDNIWIDMFRKILDGTIHIATRDEVVDRTKAVIIQDFPINQDDGYWQKWKAYATKDELYDGLYEQTDPMNYNGGNKDQNWLFFKKTGRYQAIPVVNDLYDSKAKSIPVQVKQTEIVWNGKWGNTNTKVNEFNSLYPQEYTGDLFASRHKNEWVVYYPFSYYYGYEKNASASMDLKYNTCSKLDITMQKFDAGVVKEYSDHLDFYLNNFRTDTTAVKTATIKVTGASSKPSFTYKNRSINNSISGGLNVSENWSNNVYTLTVRHMGPVDIRINCKGNASGRRTDYLYDNILTPVQPDNNYYGPIITEGEVFDYKNVQQVVTDAYAQQNSIHNHSGLGFVMMGTNSAAAIRTSLKVAKAGQYYVKFRYSAPNGGMSNYRLCIDNQSNEVGTVSFNNTGNYSSWQETSNTVSLSAGTHKFYLKAVSGGNNLAIDQMTLVPTDYQETIVSGSSAPFNPDPTTGRYVADFGYLVPSGDLQFDRNSGQVTLPAGKTGSLSITFNGADFSDVTQVRLSCDGDDVFDILSVNKTDGSKVHGGDYWSSKYLLNFDEYQSEGKNISSLVWTGTNNTSETKTMNIRQLLVQVDVMRAGKKHEQEIDRWAFGIWDGTGAEATRQGNDDEMAYNIGQCIAGYGTIYGNNSVLALNYADLTRYSKLRVYGDNGVHIRALFNRPTDTSSDFVLKEGDITDGVFEVDLRSVGSYAHLNALKVGGGTGAAWRVMVVDDNDVMDYHLYGKQYVEGNLAAALSDPDATNYDATALKNPSAVALNTANKNALIYVDNASRLSNAANVVVKNGSSYSAKNIALTDAAYVASTTADAYLAGGTTENCTWTEGTGTWTFEWGANTSNAWVEIMHWVNLTESQKGTQFRYLLIDTEEFTEKWGVNFLDGDGNILATQGYWNPMVAGGNTTKIIDIDALFAAANRSGDRSKLTKIRLFNVETTNAGKVVVKRAYLYNDAADFAYPFFAPYDIAAEKASLTTSVTDGFTTLCMPFNANVPSGFNAYSLSESGAAAANAVEANRPVLLTGSGNAEFAASNTTVKATDNLTSGLLKGAYKPAAVSSGNYVQEKTAGTAFTPLNGVTLYQVPNGSTATIYPFRAYATGETQTVEPDEPFTLTVSSAGVATLYLGFDAIIPDEDFFIPTVVKSIDGTVALLREPRGGIIPANTGVLIFANPGTYTLYPSPVPATESLSSLLHGVLTDTPVSTIKEQENGADIFVLSRGSEEYVGFKPAGSSLKTMAANKAYLPVGQTIEAKFINISFAGNMVTAIDDIKAAVAKSASNDIFDLSGRRVSNPTKGIYIIDGKKVLIK